jgi:hypothetical protein
MATHEFVVPRSMPIIFAMIQLLRVSRLSPLPCGVEILSMMKPVPGRYFSDRIVNLTRRRL